MPLWHLVWIIILFYYQDTQRRGMLEVSTWFRMQQLAFLLVHLNMIIILLCFASLNWLPIYARVDFISALHSSWKSKKPDKTGFVLPLSKVEPFIHDYYSAVLVCCSAVMDRAWSVHYIWLIQGVPNTQQWQYRLQVFQFYYSLHLLLPAWIKLQLALLALVCAF